LKRITLQSNKCIGCRLCELVCSLRDKREFSPREACVSVVDDVKQSVIHACLQCGHKMCMDGCLRKALEVDPTFGTIRVVNEKCDGCGKCVLACNNHAIQLVSPQGPVRVCDLCGGEPLCASVCPTGAIVFQDVNDLKRRKRVETSHRLKDAWRCGSHGRTSR